MNNEFWSFSQNASGGTDLYITDEIARYESWWSDTVTPNAFRRQLDRCSGDIHLYVDSPGGDAFAGNTIYELIRKYRASGKGKVIAHVSMAASAASVIIMAADEIEISLLGTIMIHDPWSIRQGNATALRATADVLDEIREGQIVAYMTRSGKTREEIIEMMTRDEGGGTYMNAKTAIENGFADRLQNADDAGNAWVQSLAMARISACMAQNAPETCKAGSGSAALKSEDSRGLVAPANHCMGATALNAPETGETGSHDEAQGNNPDPEPIPGTEETEAEFNSAARDLMCAIMNTDDEMPPAYLYEEE